MKTKTLKWALAVFGLGLVAFFACEPDPEYKDPDDDPQPGPVTDTVNQDTASSLMEFTILYEGSVSGRSAYWQDAEYYFVIKTQDDYKEVYRDFIPVFYPDTDPQEVDFSAYQVLGIFDTNRSHPTYKIGIARIEDKGEYIEVQVKRDYEPQNGSYDQAYVFAQMQKTDKPVEFVDMPFEADATASDYMPEMGVSECLNQLPEKGLAGEETVWFRFTDDGHLVIEHRSMELNCAQTIVATSMERDGQKLAISAEEQLGEAGELAMCICAKNVAYMLDVPAGQDSLEVNYRWTTFDRGLRTRTFKIPGHGSGEIYIGRIAGI